MADVDRKEFAYLGYRFDGTRRSWKEDRRGGRGQPTFHLDVLLKNFFVLNEAFQKELNALRLDGRSFETIDRRQKNSSSRKTSKLHLWLSSAPAAGLDASMSAFL